MNKKATIQRAAELAGVSIASVSRALNDKPGISVSKREEILSICRELGYVPHSLRMLPPKSGIVAVSIGSDVIEESRYMGLLWPALSFALQRTGRRLLPVNTGEMAGNELAGVVLLNVIENDPRVEHLVAKSIPFVSIGSVANQFWVAPDDFNGERMAVEYLIKRGFNRIGCVTHTGNGLVYKHRLQGYRSAMAERQLPTIEFHLEQKHSAELVAYRYFLTIESKSLQELDALVCESDEVAIGIKIALEDRGLNVPKDIAIVGFDGLPRFSKELTTIKQDVNAIAEKAAILLESAIAGEQPVGVVLPVKLKIGQTA